MYPSRPVEGCQTEATEPTEPTGMTSSLPSFDCKLSILLYLIILYLHVCVYFVGEMKMHVVQS